MSTRYPNPSRAAGARGESVCLALVLYLVLGLVPAGASDLFLVGSVESVAGGGLGDGGAALATSVLPRDVLAASDGSLYIADEQFNRVRVVSSEGVIQTVAGNGVYGFNGEGLSALESSLGIPTSLALDPEGRLYLVDLANRQIRVVEPDGTLRTFAGADEPLFSSVPGQFAPFSVAVGPEGRVHVADRGTNVVWQIDLDGTGRRAAGNGTRGYGGDGQPSALGQLADPRAIVVCEDGSIWIADTGNRRVRVVGSDGRLRTVAGNGGEDPWQESAPALEAGIKPIDVALDSDGYLLILDELDKRVVRLEQGHLRTVAQLGEESDPLAISVDATDRILVADQGRRQVVLVDPVSSGLEPVVGNGTVRASGDGDLAGNASLYQPLGMAGDNAGGVYLVDRLNHLVRQIAADGTIARVAGTGVAGISGDGGPALEAQLNKPAAVAADAGGRVYVADEGNHRIRRIDPDGTIRTVAGTGQAGYSGDGGLAGSAHLNLPSGVALDAHGRLLIADSGNGRIRRLESDGTISTVAGNGGRAAADDGGPGPQSALLLPVDVGCDDRGGMFIADADAHRVYRLDQGGLLRVVAGTGEAGAGAHGSLARSAELSGPLGVLPDGWGGVFVADSGNRRIVHVDADGVLRVVDATIGGPARLAPSPDGRGLLVADIRTHRVLRVPMERLWTSPSERIRVMDADFTLGTLAAVPVPHLMDVVHDPVAGRTFVTHGEGIEEILAGGQRLPFAQFVARSFSTLPVSGVFGRGLLLGTPAELGRTKPLTLIDTHQNGSALYFPLEFLFAGSESLAMGPDGDLFIHQSAGRVLRVPAGRLLNIIGLTHWQGSARVGEGGLEELTRLPEGEAHLAARGDGELFVALAQSRELLRVEDLDGDGRAVGPMELELVSRLPGQPVGLAVAGGKVVVATLSGRVYRMEGDRGLQVLAEEFGPSLLGICAGPTGSVLVLEGDDRAGRVLQMTPATPLLGVWPRVLDFGEMPLGESAARTLVLRNDGAVALEVAPHTASGLNLLGTHDVVRIEPGLAAEIAAALAPPHKGLYTDELIWRDATGGASLARMPVQIRGLAPELTVGEELDLGTVWVGGSRSQELALANTGQTPLQILGLRLGRDDLRIGGASVEGDGGPFSVSLEGDDVLDPGGKTSLLIRLSPNRRGALQTALNVHTNDPEIPVRTVILKGAGGRGELDISELDLGTVRVGQRLQQTVALTNTGELPLRIDRILTGTVHLIATPHRLTLEPGETRELELEFRPHQHGLVAGELTFVTNDPQNRMGAIPFQGRGVTALLELSGESHTFPRTAVGDARHWDLELTSAYPRPVRILGAAIQSRQFRLIHVPRQVLSGQTARVAVAFMPTRPGPAEAVLTLRTDLTDAPVIEVLLRGGVRVPPIVRLDVSGPRVSLWPGQLLGVSVRIEGAEALRGLLLEVVGLPESAEVASLELPPHSLFHTGGQVLWVEGASAGGNPQVGISMTGRHAAEGVSGDGLLGVLRLRVPAAAEQLVEVGLGDVLVQTATGQFVALEAPPVVRLTVQLKGDLDRDGTLSLSDYALLSGALGQSLRGDIAPHDLNGDGTIDLADVHLLARHLPPQEAARVAAATGGDLPSEAVLHSPYPNPFNSETSLVYELPQAQEVEVAVYNLLGQRVRELVRGAMGAGAHCVVWDGLDHTGEQATTGVYFLVLTTPERVLKRRALLLR